jgi:hypothetical protein
LEGWWRNIQMPSRDAMRRLIDREVFGKAVLIP